MHRWIVYCELAQPLKNDVVMVTLYTKAKTTKETVKS